MRKYILATIAVWAVVLLIFAFVLGEFEFIYNEERQFTRLFYVIVSIFGTLFSWLGVAEHS